MAKMGMSMSVASRLAAATALTGTLAACDGRMVSATDALFGPSAETASTEVAQLPPAAPGNPVYLGGSQAANDALYQQTYGAPIQGSGQSIATPQTYANSVYQDSTITASPITDIPGGPVIDAGFASSSQVFSTETAAYSAPIMTGQDLDSTPIYGSSVPQYSAPVPIPATQGVLSTDPTYVPQSSLLPTQIFSNASATDGGRDIEPLLDAMPRQTVPYGSSASHRYSAEDTVTVVSGLPDEQVLQYSPIVETAPIGMMATEPMASDFATYSVDDSAGVEVASLGGSVMPIPRARPARIGPVFEPKVVAQSAPAPVVQPAALRTTPLPTRRPIQMASISGRAITDAPALTEPPKMIQVEAVFLDELPEEVQTAPAIETAALAPAKVEKTMTDVAEAAITVIDSADLEKEMTAIEPQKVDPDTYQTIEKEVEVASLDAVQPRVEIASDVGDLKELSGTSWRLASLDGVDVPASAELHFDGNSGFAGGQGICNNYGGEFTETLKGEFDMGNIFSTETECKDYKLEKRYIVALESASQYRMAPGLKELMLLGPDGKTIATFAAF